MHPFSLGCPCLPGAEVQLNGALLVVHRRLWAAKELPRFMMLSQSAVPPE